LRSENCLCQTERRLYYAKKDLHNSYSGVFCNVA